MNTPIFLLFVKKVRNVIKWNKLVTRVSGLVYSTRARHSTRDVTVLSVLHYIVPGEYYMASLPTLIPYCDKTAKSVQRQFVCCSLKLLYYCIEFLKN